MATPNERIQKLEKKCDALEAKVNELVEAQKKCEAKAAEKLAEKTSYKTKEVVADSTTKAL